MILVSGATGKVGGELIKQLAQKGVKARALVRNPEKARTLVELGVEVAIGDYDQPETVEGALTGCERAFLVSPASPRAVEHESGFIESAKRAGLRRIVKLSALGSAADSPVKLLRGHAEVEKRLAASELEWVSLRPTMFMQNFLNFLPTLTAEDVFYAPSDAPMPFVHVRDIAAVAAHALTEDGTVGQTLVVTGPEALTFPEAAALISAGTGRNVSFVKVSAEDAKQALLGRGLPEFLADDLVKLYEVAGAPEMAKVYDTVARLTGKWPREFSGFVREELAPVLK